MEFHEKLQELRKQKGLTQEELAEVLYVSRAAISKWESGRGYPSIDSLKEISRYFSVTIDDLLSGEKLLSIAKPLPALIRTQKVVHKTAKEMPVPSPEASDRLTADEKRIGDMLISAINECEKLGLEAETVLRHYCDAMIDSIKKQLN